MLRWNEKNTKGSEMANRSYIYLKNGDEARVLAEGIYMIP